MADTCIFCGKEIGFWQADQLTCGGVSQPVCGKCADKYADLPQHQRARLALETGRARDSEGLQSYLDRRAEKLEREARRRDFQEKTLVCCGQRMVQVEEVSFLSRVSLFQTYTDTMVMFRCDCCGQVKFFDASFLYYTPPQEDAPVLSQVPETEETEKLVTCPVCGKEHSPLIGCPRCALRGGQEKRTTYAPKKKQDKRPPWEK